MTTIKAITTAVRGLVAAKPLTIDGILATHQKTITELETVASTQAFQAEQAEAEAVRQKAIQNVALAEVARANTIITKMKSIFA